MISQYLKHVAAMYERDDAAKGFRREVRVYNCSELHCLRSGERRVEAHVRSPHIVHTGQVSCHLHSSSTLCKRDQTCPPFLAYNAFECVPASTAYHHLLSCVSISSVRNIPITICTLTSMCMLPPALVAPFPYSTLVQDLSFRTRGFA